MADTFRALCAEMLSALEREGYAHWVNGPDEDELCLRARVALASTDEPAVPEGREPAAVITEPSDEEWDALVERAWDKYQTVGYQGERFMYDGDFGSALDLVRKELARWGNLKASLTSSPPADGEVAECAAELLQRQVLVPVSVSERLPEAEDCDAEGMCWWGTPSFANNYIVTQSAQWRLCAPDDRFGSELLWLPAHALPRPEVSE